MSKDTQFAFEDEVFFSLKKQRNSWAIVAMISLAVAVLSLGAFIAVLPLKESIPFVVMVDKTTGAAEKVVQVRPTTLTEQQAVLEAELVSYVSDRETYDVADNEERIPFVLGKSDGQAETGIRQLWTSASEDYPPALYGDDIRITVKIKSVSPLPDTNLARVRFTKTREREGEPNVERSFVATVGYEFEPRRERNLQELWKNPLGFKVISYRIDAETLQQ